VANGGANNIIELTPGGAQSTYASGLDNPVGLAIEIPEPSVFGLLAVGIPALLVRRCFFLSHFQNKPRTQTGFVW
jgi:hypothetical protein